MKISKIKVRKLARIIQENDSYMLYLLIAFFFISSPIFLFFLIKENYLICSLIVLITSKTYLILFSYFSFYMDSPELY